MPEKEQNTFLKRDTIVGLLLCLCFLGCSILFLCYMMGQNQDDNLKYLTNAAVQHQNTLLKQINGDFQTLDGIAVCLGEMESSSGNQTLDILKTINNSNNFIRMGLAELDGTLDLLDINGAQYSNLDVSQEPFFQQALAGFDAVSNTYVDHNAAGYINYYAVPIYDVKHEMTGILCAVNSADMFREIVDTPFLNNTGFSSIIDSSGAMVIRSQNQNVAGIFGLGDLKEIDERERQDMEAALQDGAEASFTYSAGKTTLLGFLKPLGVNDWYIFSSVPLFALQQRYGLTAIGIVAIIIMACGIFLFLLSLQRRMNAKSQALLMHLAYDDPLLPCGNFQKFLLEAPKLLDGQNGARYAIWYCDLKKFKYYNDVLGYQEGDGLLRRMAELLDRMSQEVGGIFCRVSADNFVGLRPYRAYQELEEWYEKLVELLRQQENQQANRLYVELCMGVYCVQPDESNLSVNDMVNWANMAQKSAKKQPGSQFAFFSPEIRAQSASESQLSAQAEEAVKNGQFQIYLQPKVNIQEGDRITSAEVLSRWIHPEKGLIPPGEFIPVFEENGMIVQLDRYILEETCRWLSAYLAEGRPPIRLAVNVSRLGMVREDFVEYYALVKTFYGIPDGVLELEFTESVVLDGEELFYRTVEELRRNGFVCSMDDFGSGYSSLNLLKNLQLDVLKLDILFFHHSIDQERERIVTSNVIRMARQLHMMTVAEGVESVENVEFLRKSGCDLVQGYAFFRPMPLADFDRLLREQGDRAVIPRDVY